jgi:hypothetical protein
VAAATSDYAAAEAEMQSAKLLIQTSLVQAYAELARLYLNRDTTQNALEIRSKTVELMAERNSNGLETDGVVRQMQALKERAEAELIAADESIQLQKTPLPPCSVTARTAPCPFSVPLFTLMNHSTCLPIPASISSATARISARALARGGSRQTYSCR